LWTDRGLATWAGLQFLRSTGIHATSAMAMNRIGLPRRYMKRLLKSFRCSRGCSHGVDAASCKRWCWTVLHKGDWELQLWCDGEALVAAMTDCTSAMRTIVVGRTVAKKCVLVHVQEGIGMYSTFARSATDSGDQQRKRLQLASRRQTRQGPKGALFDAEIGFVNGSIMAKHLRGRGEVTAWNFALEFYTDVIRSVTMRQRLTTELRATQPLPVSVPADSRTVMTRTRLSLHVPRNFVSENRRSRQAGDSQVPPRWVGRGKHCCLQGECHPQAPKRPVWWCSGCAAEREECTGWYHEDCFWKRHSVRMVP
jgi:hypothetical protein